jgi:NAD(P)-dependent dehydrogenase (short-subunit alcohol dehydrogenase family)
MKFDQVKALVTGGASGLGLSVARHIVAAGGKVCLLDINDKAGPAVACELGNDTCYIHTDVTSEAAVIRAVDESLLAHGSLNLVVNCAGVIGAGRVLGREAPMELSVFTHTVMINLVGSFNVAKAAADRMQHNEPGPDGERGLIINTASVAAWEGQIGQAAYSASKSGIVGMTLPMAREFSRIGIRVMTIAPGIFWTPMVGGMPEQVQQSLAASIPFPSAWAAREFAHVNTSPKTCTSMAPPFGSTAQCGWRQIEAL